MDTIKASEFKAKCLQLMDQVARTGGELTITKNGVPVAKLVPTVPRGTTLIGRHRGMMDISGDIESPVDVTWEASE
jgi:prevent-host-death family protein